MSPNYRVQIIVSEDMEVQQQGPKQINKIVNPALVMRVPFVPTGLSLAVTIITTGIDFNKEKRVRIYIKDPVRNDILYEADNKLSIEGAQSDNFNFNLDLKNIPFKYNGTYEVHFELEGHDEFQEFDVIGNEDLLNRKD